MPLMEAKGFKFFLLKKIEQVTYFFSTKLLCNSCGLVKYINQTISSKKISVVGYGSINGVDIEYFKDNFSSLEKLKFRDSLNIGDKDFVLTYIGRVVKDKGVNELIEVFIELSQKYSYLKLLIVGDIEQNLNPIKLKNLQLLKEHPSIIFKEFSDDIRSYFGVSDTLILPSYREGLPNILLEAGCFGLPIIATNINGCNEIVIQNKNGLLFENKNKVALKNKVELLISNPDFLYNLKSNARECIVDRFSQKVFQSSLLEVFKNEKII
jgi:glycosyltransferase involved in cell wall biosynthesis